MGVGATGEPTVSMRLGDDHADKRKQAKQFNKEIDQAKQAPDDDAAPAENAPQRKAIGGWPTTGSLVTIPQFTDEQIYGETDAALKRIDTQIAEDREISKKPYEKRLQHARNRVSDGMDTWGTPKYNATKMTGDMVWNYGRNNTWTNAQGRELPFFTEGEKKAVYEDQNSKQQWAQQEQKEANERELTRVQIARDQQVKNGFDQIRSPATVLQPFAFAAVGAPVFAAYAGIQTGKAVGDAYNACKNGPTTECLAATAHAGIAVATDVYALKPGAPSKGPQVDPPSSSIQPSPTTSKSSPPGGTNVAAVSGEIIKPGLPGGAPHAPAQPKVIVDRSAYDVEPGQAGMRKALGLDPSKTRVVAHASDGHGADFDVVASPARAGGPARPVGAGAAGGGAAGTGGGSGPLPTTTPATQSRDARIVSPSSSNAPTATATPIYDVSLNKNNVDWRGKGKTFDDAIQEAFKQTGVPIEKFRETKWVKTEYGKTVPVEWTGPRGAQVAVDVQHKPPAPDIPHVNWQGPGRGAPSGHIFVDQTPYGRAP